MEIKKSIVLRKASMEDAELLFQWKNDKVTIANSISKRGVTMEEHLKWLEKVIENPNRQLFILDVDGKSVGQLRLDLEKMPSIAKKAESKETGCEESERKAAGCEESERKATGCEESERKAVGCEESEGKEAESEENETLESDGLLKRNYELIAEISYGLGEEFRGKGLGKVLLEQAETLAAMFHIHKLTAEVLPHNIASQKLFRDLGFAEEKKDDIYVYRKQYR